MGFKAGLNVWAGSVSKGNKVFMLREKRNYGAQRLGPYGEKSLPHRVYGYEDVRSTHLRTEDLLLRGPRTYLYEDP